jgi:hypothetical protein
MPEVSLHMCALLWAANRLIRIPAAELRTLLQVMTGSLLEPIHPPHRPPGALLKWRHHILRAAFLGAAGFLKRNAEALSANGT